MNTAQKLQQHLAAPKIHTLSFGDEVKDVAPLLKCADGTTMSVQASKAAYSTPRANRGPYTHVEVWHYFTEAWNEYGNGEDPYAYLPIELVIEEIDRHGGIAQEDV